MVFERAKELGRMLGQSDEYRALVRANERLKEDTEANQLLEQLKGLEERLQGTIQRGEEPIAADRDAHEGLLRRIEALPGYQGFVAAQTNFDKLMAKVNAQILDGMKDGAASPSIALG
jgi:cell fate (sporulation/competence/biofilm development) regulator YlbF (YheA/YmcA/DUF963 family)